MKKKKIDLQELYLQLLGSWGDSPLDEEAVKEILADHLKLVRKETAMEIIEILHDPQKFTWISRQGIALIAEIKLEIESKYL